MKLLYIDEQLVDLHQTTVIAQTLQVFDPGRVGSILTNYTSAIKVPRTSNNEKILGFLSNSKTKSDIPYASLSCRYVENGIPIIRNARVVLNEVSEDYSLTIYSGPWGFFEVVQSKTLWDLDFSDINGPWDDTVRDGYRTATDGIVQALVDDGRLVQDQASAAPTIENQGELFKPPQIYYHTIIEKVFSSFGFSAVGDIFTNPVFLKLVMPLSVIYNDPSFLEAKQFVAAALGDQIMVNPVVATDVIFNQNVVQGSDNFYDGTSKYVVNNPDTAARYYNLQFWVDLSIIVTGGTVDISINFSGPGDQTLTNTGTGQYTMSFLTPLGHADIVKVDIIKNSGTPTVEIISGSFYSVSVTGTDGFEFFPSIFGEYVYFQKLFEKITILQMLQDFCVRFNVQITQVNNILQVNTMNYILDLLTGPDWTNKRNKGPEKIKYSFSSYGRTNFLKSPTDDFTPDLTDNYGDGSFEIPNENLKESLTIYTSIFAVTQMINTFGVLMLNMNLLPDLTNFGRMPGKRLFFVREPYDFEPPVLYDTVDRSDYLVGYYFDPMQTNSVGYQFFLDTFYQKFIDRCLRKVRLIEREYNLSDLDIFKFNQQLPIYDNNERFLVTKIVNRVSKKVCKVELLKIDSNPEHFFVQGQANNITGALEDTLEEIGDNLSPILTVQMELIESVTGNPTWETTYDNGADVDVRSCNGNGASNSGTLNPHVGSLDVDADVLKTANDGNGPTGFPVDTGYVEWLRNGVQVNTVTFDGSTGSSAQGLNYTYLNVKAWEVLKVIVHEDGSTP